MTLPKEKQVADTGFPAKATWLLFGAPKVGKTTFAAQWPEVLILDLEGGTRYVAGAYVLEIQGLKELRDVYAELRALGKNGELPYQTVVIDTIDVVNEWCEAEVCKELGIAQMGQASYGADWGAVRTRVLELIKAFAQLPVNLVIVSHSRWAVVNDINVGHTIDLPGRLARFVLAAAENILFATVDKGERKLVFQPHEGIEAGSRHPVLDKAGSCALSFEAMRALFNEPLEEPKKKAVKKNKSNGGGFE